MQSVAVTQPMETEGLLQRKPASTAKNSSDLLDSSQSCWKFRYERGLLYTLLILFTSLAVMGQTRKLWANNKHTGGMVKNTKRTVVYHRSFTLHADATGDSSSSSSSSSDDSRTCCDIADEDFDCEAEDINEFCDCSEVCSGADAASGEEGSDSPAETTNPAEEAEADAEAAQTTNPAEEAEEDAAAAQTTNPAEEAEEDAAAAQTTALIEERRRLIIDKFLCCDVEFVGGVCSDTHTYNVTIYCEEEDRQTEDDEYEYA